MTIDVLRDVTHVMDSLSPDQNQLLDRWSDRLQGLVNVGLEQGGPAARRMKNWLNGVWFGHPLHPALTDVTLGAWSTGFLLDIVGARGPADAATTVGVLSAVPTALAGAADWSDTSDEPRRTGLVHALLNSVGLAFMLGSLFARRTERRALGFGLSTVGLFLSGLSAWLGKLAACPTSLGGPLWPTHMHTTKTPTTPSSSAPSASAACLAASW